MGIPLSRIHVYRLEENRCYCYSLDLGCPQRPVACLGGDGWWYLQEAGLSGKRWVSGEELLKGMGGGSDSSCLLPGTMTKAAVCHILPPWCSALGRPRSNSTDQPQTKTSESQSQNLEVFYCRHFFSHNGKLINYEVNDFTLPYALALLQAWKQQWPWPDTSKTVSQSKPFFSISWLSHLVRESRLTQCFDRTRQSSIHPFLLTNQYKLGGYCVLGMYQA